MLKRILTASLAILFWSSYAYAQGAKEAAYMAKQAETGSKVTAGANLTEAEKHKSGCSSGVMSALSCTFMVASLAQMAYDLASKKDAQTTGAGFKNDFDPTFPNPDGGPNTPANLDELTAKVNSELDTLAKKGYKYDPKTNSITTPKGRVPVSALSSAKAMADVGLIDADQIPDAEALLRKIAKDSPKVVSMAMASGGGGGGGAAPKYSYDDPYAALYAQEREKPNGPKTDGLTRTLASGESIGSSLDNIFKMVTRRYQAKSAENIFVGP